MTLATGFFSYVTTSRSNVDVVLEPTRGEVIGMPETVSCLGRVFADKPRRRVAVVANCHRSVARLHPTGILFVHYVTVNTCLRVICHVGITPSVNERVRTDADGQAESNAQNDPWRQSKVHQIDPTTRPASRLNSRCVGLTSVFSRMTFYALEHCYVAKIHRMLEWLVGFVAGFAFPIR